MLWLFWRISCALQLSDRYELRFIEAWQEAGRYRGEFDRGATPDEVVWGED